MTTDAELRRLAESATPGPYEYTESAHTLNGGEFAVWQEGAKGDGRKRIACWIIREATAGMIAALDPVTVLSLLDRLADAEKREKEAYRWAAEQVRNVANMYGSIIMNAATLAQIIVAGPTPTTPKELPQ